MFEVIATEACPLHVRSVEVSPLQVRLSEVCSFQVQPGHVMTLNARVLTEPIHVGARERIVIEGTSATGVIRLRCPRVEASLQLRLAVLADGVAPTRAHRLRMQAINRL
jgi:hypothetical protein